MPTERPPHVELAEAMEREAPRILGLGIITPEEWLNYGSRVEMALMRRGDTPAAEHREAVWNEAAFHPGYGKGVCAVDGLPWPCPDSSLTDAIAAVAQVPAQEERLRNLLAEVGRVAVGVANDWMGDPDHGFILDSLVAPIEAWRRAVGLISDAGRALGAETKDEGAQ